MIKKIDIMGIGLDNYTVRESMRQVENYLSNDVLNTIENISMQMLIASETDPVVHNVISELDLSVIGEKEILKAADADSMQRVQETEQNDFSYEFYRRIERNKRSIFVLGQTEEDVQKVKAELQEAFPKLILAGEYALENCVGNLDAVINEMNATTPDVIVSILPSPLQEHFFAEHKDKMSATIWFGMGELGVHGKKHGLYHGISFTKAVGPAAFVTKVRAILLRDTGATLSPFNSFLLLQGLETLSLRVERHVENALKVVKYLESQPQVEKVHHPSVSDDPKQQALYAKYFPNGGGSIFTFEIKGDAQKAKDFIDNLELFSLLANVADVKSLVIHPATTTHSQCTEEELLDQGIKPNTIRLSIGTENVDDIIEDLDEAFKAVQ